MGYFPLGVAFGVLAKSMGVSAFIAVALSTLAYGGAAQFMMLSLFSVGTSYVEVFIVSYLVNLRHTFYGISLLKEYSGIKFKLLNIALLTDETFAIFKNLGLKDPNLVIDGINMNMGSIKARLEQRGDNLIAQVVLSACVVDLMRYRFKLLDGEKDTGFFVDLDLKM